MINVMPCNKLSQRMWKIINLGFNILLRFLSHSNIDPKSFTVIKLENNYETLQNILVTPFSFSHIAQFSFIAGENAIKIIHVDFLFPICILKHENYDLAWVISRECCRCSQIHIRVEKELVMPNNFGKNWIMLE